MRSITLQEVATLSEPDLQRVREIRNAPNVRAWMYTDHEISQAEHLRWVHRLKYDDRQIVFAVIEDERPVGVASINAIDTLHRKADWAFYLDESARGGLGAALELAMIEFAFGPLGLDKLNCEVIEGNAPVLKLHAKFGFKQEGFREANIIKGGRRIGVHFLGLRADQWDVDAVRERYADLFNKFSVSITRGETDWEAMPLATDLPGGGA